MKKKISAQIITIGIFSLLIAFSSCKKKDTNDTTPTSTTGTLQFHLHTDADTNEVGAYGDTLTMTGGRKIVVTLVQLYISGIQLVKADGTIIDGPAVNVLKRQEEELSTIGSVPAGNYKSVKFKIGLSSATNSSTPSASDTLGLYRPEMWFGSVAQPDGWIFVNFQGSIDTTTAGNGSALVPFSYKIGTNAHLTSITMPDQNFTVTPDQASVVHMIIDYSKLFTGITLNVNGNLQINTVTENAWPLATHITNNMSGMIRYE